MAEIVILLGIHNDNVKKPYLYEKYISFCEAKNKSKKFFQKN